MLQIDEVNKLMTRWSVETKSLSQSFAVARDNRLFGIKNLSDDRMSVLKL